MTGRRRRLLLVGLLVLLVAASAAQAAGAKAMGPKAPTRQTQFYVALGDSYAVGYQGDVKHTTRHGYVNQLVPLAAQRGYRFKLLQLGCGGATTQSMLTQIGCPAAARAPGAPAYNHQTQTQAAVAFIKHHRGRVGLVTVSIGGNDIDSCIPLPNPVSCVANRMPAATANLTKIVKRLRSAGGKQMMIIGSTYPDVVLGAWVRPDTFGEGRFTLAADSITAFVKYINPGLKRAYDRVGAEFVDVTAATGAYGPFATRIAPSYGRIPIPVAEVCRLTFFCKFLDIHMTTAGYGIIARLEAALLPRLLAAKPR